MADWFYKATNTKLDYVGTLLLANRGFLCRSAYTSKRAWVANVQSVSFGDTLNFYFIGRTPRPLAAYEIIQREEFKNVKATPSAEDFAGPVPGCALYEVTDPTFIGELDPAGGYAPDPVLGKYTGWLLRKKGNAAAAPKSFLANRASLVRA